MCSPLIGRPYRDCRRYITFCHFGSSDDFPSFTARGRISASSVYRYVCPLDPSVWSYIKSLSSAFLVFAFNVSGTFTRVLSYIGPKDPGSIPLIVQLLIADLGIEVLRMAAIHTPSPMTTAMGLVAAIVIGQVAIEVGLFTGEVIFTLRWLQFSLLQFRRTN